MPYVSDNSAEDRDKLLGGVKINPVSGEKLIKYPLRNLFISENHVEIVKIIWAYFQAISDRWPAIWSARDSGTMLYRTNDFKAFMRFF